MLILYTPSNSASVIAVYNAVLEFTWDCLDGARQYIIQQVIKLNRKATKA